MDQPQHRAPLVHPLRFAGLLPDSDAAAGQFRAEFSTAAGRACFWDGFFAPVQDPVSFVGMKGCDFCVMREWEI